MPRENYYRKLFLIGAIWNWMATLPLIFGYKILFPIYDMILPQYPVFLILFAGLCFIFGVGYYLVSRDLSKNHGIVWMGITGKIVVFVGFLWAAFIGQIHYVWIGAGIVDLIYAILFLEFLSTAKKHGL